MAQGGTASIMDFAGIPISIILGIALGAAFGYLLAWMFEYAHRKNESIRQSLKAIIVLGSAFMLMTIENLLEGVVPVSGLFAVMSMVRSYPDPHQENSIGRPGREIRASVACC